jgi:hypothetical protein
MAPPLPSSPLLQTARLGLFAASGVSFATAGGVSIMALGELGLFDLAPLPGARAAAAWLFFARWLCAPLAVALVTAHLARSVSRFRLRPAHAALWAFAPGVSSVALPLVLDEVGCAAAEVSGSSSVERRVLRLAWAAPASVLAGFFALVWLSFGSHLMPAETADVLVRGAFFLWLALPPLLHAALFALIAAALCGPATPAALRARHCRPVAA